MALDSIRRRKLQKNKKSIVIFILCGVFFLVPFILADKEDLDIVSIVVFLSFFIFSIGAALLCYIRCITSLGERMVKQYISRMGNTMQIEAHVDSFFESKRITEDVWLSQKYIAGIYNTNTIFRELSDLLWIYPVYMTGQSLDPAVALALNATKSQGYLKMHFVDGKNYTIQLSSEEDVWIVLETIKTFSLDIVTIHTPELEKAFQNKEYPFME